LRPEKWEASPDRAGSSHNDACGIGADRTVKPVFTVDQMKTVAIRHHVTTTVRQADEVPESAFIFRHHFFRQPAHDTAAT